VLKNSIKSGESWKELYNKTAQEIATANEKPWKLESPAIFAQVDAFVQRCKDLLDITSARQQLKWPAEVTA
jgi:dynein heavy chain